MIYCNTPLSGSLQSPMQILQSRSTRSHLSNAARQQLGLQPEKLRNVSKNEHLPSHDQHIEQDIMYQDARSKWWYPATITSLCVQPRSYSVTYRKTQDHLKPYQLQCKKSEGEHSDIQSSNMWTLKLTASSLRVLKIKTIKCNLILDQRGTLSPQSNMICNNYVNIWSINWI